MTDFAYRLAVLTHGRMATLAAALASFYEHISPAPAEIRIYGDGVDLASHRAWLEQYDVEALMPDYPIAEMRSPRRLGFCGATGALWQWASEGEIPYVFWLEHDFIFLRDVDLRELAVALDADQRIAQLALVRGSVNPREREAGGLIESRPGEFEAMCGAYDGTLVHPTRPWMRHRSFFTTNPSLMRRRFMQENPWPADGQPECEGRYGLDLVARGYAFGYWGAGEQWVDHIGVRTGRGY